MSALFVYKFTVPLLAAPGALPWFESVSVPLARLPTTLVLPLTVKFPVSVSENALIPPVELMLLNVGEAGSLGKITFGNCFVVIPGPLISISYFPGAA